MKSQEHPSVPISMMGKWARFDFCRDSSLIRGRGRGGLISHFILSKIVGVLVWSAKTELFN